MIGHSGALAERLELLQEAEEILADIEARAPHCGPAQQAALADARRRAGALWCNTRRQIDLLLATEKRH